MSKGLLDPQSEKFRELELSIEEIRQAKDELIRMSNDSTQRELYDMRANSLKDKISELNAAERKGIENGRKEGIEEGAKNKMIEIARNMKSSGLDTNTIAMLTNLSNNPWEEYIIYYFTPKYSSNFLSLKNVYKLNF